MKFYACFLWVLILLFLNPQESNAQEALVNGPLLKKRQQALNYLKKAEKYGVGIKPYMKAFNKLESDVKNGLGEAEIKKRVDSITRSAYQQMLRARDSKMHRMRQSQSGDPLKKPYINHKDGNPPMSALENVIYYNLNKARKEAGLETVRRNSKLAALARAHSKDMAAKNYFNHVDTDRRDAYARAQAAGLNISIFENIANIGRGGAYDKAEIAHRQFMRSPKHKANILRKGIKSCGVGCAFAKDRKLRVTQLFSMEDP